MYPETKGVPLEEMDAVFGEGNFSIFPHEIAPQAPPDERDEQLENESERTSLVTGNFPTNHQTISAHPRSLRTGERSWLSRMFNRTDGRTRYEPVEPDEE